ncbi:hypothetical protein [Salinimicrobium sp. GXAS 041]|uniref:hypothetical protein n=1 Tax=Salinimicrobium sp. GXAS 041 TaxID=3400806 RepID=UPI003C726736
MIIKKLLLILFAAFLIGCSTEDDKKEEMCCEHTVEYILDHINTEFPRLLAQDLSDEQRRLIEAEYEEALQNPCDYFKKELESTGASCENPW